MINLIRSDFYKLFRMKSFYVCCIVAAGLALLQTGIVKLMYNMAEATLGNMTVMLELSDIKSLLRTAMSDGNWTLLAIIAIALFITIEYNAGTLKNIASRGFTRESIYFSKLIVSVVESFIICLVYAFVYVATCLIFFDTSGLTLSFVGELAVTYAVNLLIAIAITSFIAMIAYIVRSKGGAIALGICLYLVVIPMVLQMINLFSYINSDETGVEDVLEASSTNVYGNYAYYWIGTLPSTVTECYQNGTLYIPVLVTLAYLVVSVGIGLAVFKKRDIK